MTIKDQHAPAQHNHSDKVLAGRYISLLKRNVPRAAAKYPDVADILGDEWRKFAEIEFIMNACDYAIDVEGGKCDALTKGYIDIAEWFGLYRRAEVISVAKVLYRMAQRLPNGPDTDEIKTVLLLKYLDTPPEVFVLRCD